MRYRLIKKEQALKCRACRQGSGVGGGKVKHENKKKIFSTFINPMNKTLLVMKTPKTKTIKTPISKKSNVPTITKQDLVDLRIENLTKAYIDLSEDAELFAHRSTVSVWLSIISIAISIVFAVTEIARLF